jgi:hypothetical protein
MVKRINALTPEQRAKMAGHADEWIKIGWSTEPAEFDKFADAARRCYEFADLPWHNNVVQVSSPLVLALAAPIAACWLSADASTAQLFRERQQEVTIAVADALRDKKDRLYEMAMVGVYDPISKATTPVGNAVGDAVRADMEDGTGLLGGSSAMAHPDSPVVVTAVTGAVTGAMRDSRLGVQQAVRDAVDAALDTTIQKTSADVRSVVGFSAGRNEGEGILDILDGAVGDVGAAVNAAVNQAVNQVIRAAFAHVHAGTTGQPRAHDIFDAVNTSVDGAVSDAVGVDVSEAMAAVVTNVREAIEAELGPRVALAVNAVTMGTPINWTDGPLSQVLDAIGAVVGTGSSVRDGVREAVETAVGTRVHNAVVSQTGAGVVSDGVTTGVGGAVEDVVGIHVEQAIGEAVRLKYRTIVVDDVHELPQGGVTEAIGQEVRVAVGSVVKHAVESVHAAVYHGVDDAIRVAVDSAARKAVTVAAAPQVRLEAASSVGDWVRAGVASSIGEPVHVALREAVRLDLHASHRQATNALDGVVGNAARADVIETAGVVAGAAADGVSDAIRTGVRDAMRRVTENIVNGSVREVIRDGWYRYLWGNLGPQWQAFYSFFREHCDLELPGDLNERSRAYEDSAKYAGWWWPHKQFTMVCDRPAVLHLEQVAPRGWGSHRLHCEDGPAIAWRDGYALHFWHGVRVPADLIEGDGWAAERILREPNAEVRRCAIERVGWDRFVSEAHLAQVGDEVPDPGNPGHTLSLYDVPEQIYEEPVRVLLCTNATEERDGTRRRFGLTVPASISNPIAAAGWTFGLNPSEYATMQRAS